MSVLGAQEGARCGHVAGEEIEGNGGLGGKNKAEKRHGMYFMV